MHSFPVLDDLDETRAPPAASWLVVLLACVSVLGCKSMTEARRRVETEAPSTAANVEAANEEAKALQANVEKEKSELERKKAELERTLERERLTREAIDALAAGDAQGALSLAEELLVETTRKIEPMAASTEDAGDAPEPPPDAGIPPLVISDDEKARLRVIKGTALHELGDESGALAEFREASRLDPDHRTARRNLGKLLFREGRFEEALTAWKNELGDGYRDADLLYLVAQARYEVGSEKGSTGELEAAKLAMQQVLVERPDDPEVRRWLAMLEYETESWREAIRHFRLILKNKPLDPGYLELLANAHIQLGEHRNAIDVLELAIRVGNARPELARTLGQLYSMENLPASAASWLSRSYENEPARAPSDERYRIGMLWAEAEDLDRAVTWLESLRESDPEFFDAQARLAYLFSSRGRVDESLAAFEKIRESDAHACAASLAAGDIYLERKQLERAQETFSRASALGGDCRADGLAGLAEVAYSREDLAHAVRLYRQALEARPADPRFKTALKEIEEELRVKEQFPAESPVATLDLTPR